MFWKDTVRCKNVFEELKTVLREIELSLNNRPFMAAEMLQKTFLCDIKIYFYSIKINLYSIK